MGREIDLGTPRSAVGPIERAADPRRMSVQAQPRPNPSTSEWTVRVTLERDLRQGDEYFQVGVWRDGYDLPIRRRKDPARAVGIALLFAMGTDKECFYIDRRVPDVAPPVDWSRYLEFFIAEACDTGWCCWLTPETRAGGHDPQNVKDTFRELAGVNEGAEL